METYHIGLTQVMRYARRRGREDEMKKMFLMRGDGTPYDLVYNAVGGNPVLYPLSVVGLFLLYIAVFYHVVFLIHRKQGIDRTESDDERR